METEYHTELETRVNEFVVLNGHHPVINHRLPHGKFADIVYITKDNDIVIIEVKTTLNHSLVQEARRKYRPYCHKLYIAAPEVEIDKYVEPMRSYDWSHSMKDIGLLAITDRAVKITRDAPAHKIPEDVITYLGWKLRDITGQNDRVYKSRAKLSGD